MCVCIIIYLVICFDHFVFISLVNNIIAKIIPLIYACMYVCMYVCMYIYVYAQLYVYDALSNRLWVDDVEAKPFVDNMLTAFDHNTNNVICKYPEPHVKVCYNVFDIFFCIHYVNNNNNNNNNTKHNNNTNNNNNIHNNNNNNNNNNNHTLSVYKII